MANIVINELSSNYTYNVAGASYATVALPITAQWGPGYFRNSIKDLSKNPSDHIVENDIATYMEGIVWKKYTSSREGLEAFVSDYRGPISNYRMLQDYSYQAAITLLSSGYDLLTCRVSFGEPALRHVPVPKSDAAGAYVPSYIGVDAKYPGTFGNNLLVSLRWANSYAHQNDPTVPDYLNLVVYVIDSSGLRVSAENLVFRIEEGVDDSIPMWNEVESSFVTINYITNTTGITDGGVTEANDDGEGSTTPYGSSLFRQLVGGNDSRSYEAVGGTPEEPTGDTVVKILANAKAQADVRFAPKTSYAYSDKFFGSTAQSTMQMDQAKRIEQREWTFTAAWRLYDKMTDKLSYNPNRIISPGWDDQNFDQLDSSPTYSWPADNDVISPLHKKLMDVAYNSRCGTALLDVPISIPRSRVYDDADGYAQMLARSNADPTMWNNSIYSTHSALFAPWGKYTYVGMNKQTIASPSFLTLMIQRAMILNQPLQYEWALPTSRRHNLRIGQLAYNVPKKVLDQWQSLEGVGVNAITTIPDLGTVLWGNSTLYEVPPATYQALANLSTRYLVNAVENVIYRCGISITYHYNNEEAYAAFYAGVTPILDTMKNTGAIDDYYVRMAADINGLDQVNANTVIGKVYLVVNGVINDIVVDLIALPPGTDLNQFVM